MEEKLDDLTVSQREIENMNENLGNWEPRPRKKKSKFGTWVIIFFLVLLLVGGFLYWFRFSPIPSAKEDETSTASSSSIASIEVGPYEDIEEIVVLKKEASVLYDAHIQAWLLQDPELESKINLFEEKLDMLMETTYQYYVVEERGGWKVADNSFIDYLQNLAYEGTVKLSQDSIPYYLEQFHALGNS